MTTMICSCCKERKTAIEAKEYRRGTEGRVLFIYHVDAKGRRWNETVCYTCDNLLGPAQAEDTLWRKCRQCGKKTVNYFKCEICKSAAEEPHDFGPGSKHYPRDRAGTRYG